MKKALSVILCICTVLSLALLSSCGGPEKGKPVEIKLISRPATGYAWRLVVSREGIVEVSETFEEDEDNKEDPKGGWQIYTVTPVGAGEVSLDFAYVAPGVERVDLAATYVYTVDKDLNMKEKMHEGTYFDLDNVVPQNTYIIRLDVDGSGNRWDYDTNAEGIVEISPEYVEDPFATESDTKKGEQVFTIMGMKQGEVTVTFTYADENGENATNNAVFDLFVDEGLIVSETKHSGDYFKEE